MRMGQRSKQSAPLIGDGTNNVAEYQAAIEGVKKAKSLGAKEIELRMDSELVVCQINDDYQVRSDTMKTLHAQLTRLLQSFDKYCVKYVPREQDTRADELANLAYERRSMHVPDANDSPHAHLKVSQ